MKQTFIIHINPEVHFKENEMKKWDFYRVGCKTIKTCRKYIKSWREQAEMWRNLYKKTLLAEGATYAIESTPNGYSGEIVEQGLIADLL